MGTSANISIRLATAQECELVLQLVLNAFREYEGILIPPSGALRETADSIRAKMEQQGGAVIAEAKDSGLPLGAALYRFVDQHLYIGRVSVIPQGRGQGAGVAMMRALEQLAIDHGIEETRVSVRCSLPGNVAFYERLSYEVFEHLFYPERTDSWFEMKKRLTARMESGITPREQ
ncbi:ribosomal protein S18 acetylase RimI-like enzyme [Paenibacillus phyllosphaerae]|uniref:Ribosomal protein S18 acetylase RimI-like enzyme n=1 Tax=Paenibacillus phyllosphaerae TaxID=274593 RepID=A0A7W5FP69_9BACL|nr:GNAT family N-acetyltransferase [Paenibacillus phyllosphaerae]MBB3111912.1 ribosomal protein S18 acetylase RimI-like enzyme [Paenibacillus phyllosphaerae]